MDIIKQGGYNTGRMYGPFGQRVYWWFMRDHSIIFCDLDRMIVGQTKEEYDDLGATAWWVQAQYDKNAYHMACQPAIIPKDFDFGVKLRI